ncbi:MAG: hypothetical protein [Wendovervirus sonii]|uniref:Uncharacterized protein n=1 Tax=phage Lak_Megaphage_Sonny TaxID=3109229 RepID=A0ABZ0Z5M7_9CAUD|nr:MAG: hypothetical protein [phage Lak_Megaphage_Sonny]
MMKRINEKLSISDNVQNEVIKFNDYLKNKSCNYSKDCNFDYIFFEIPFKIYFRFNELSDNHFGQTNLLTNTLMITHCKNVDILNTLYHEILHIFQYKKNKQLYQNDIIYKNACNAIKNNSNDFDLLFAYALYASFDFEQDAMIHGLYGALQDLPVIIAKNYINESDEYAYILDMKNALSIIDKNPNAFNEKLFKMNVSQYMQIIQKGLNRFETKICKLLQKIKDNEELNEGLIHIYHKKHKKFGHIKIN